MPETWQEATANSNKATRKWIKFGVNDRNWFAAWVYGYWLGFQGRRPANRGENQDSNSGADALLSVAKTGKKAPEGPIEGPELLVQTTHLVTVPMDGNLLVIRTKSEYMPPRSPLSGVELFECRLEKCSARNTLGFPGQ